MEELCKFNLKTNVIWNGMEKYLIFSINSKLSFIESLQFLSSSLDNLVKDLHNDDFKYLNQEFENSVLDLVKQKRFYLYEYMNHFENFNEKLPSKEKMYSSLRGKKLVTKKQHVFNVWKKIKIKTMTDDYDLCFKCDVLLLAYVFEKFRNDILKNYGLCPSHYFSAPALS